ncbi:response regulator transcription factor [Neptunomonas qingdaonensis]|uniref:Two-component system, LuxR family, response regulator FixJ n=1 Tax=Neptunomonas qingdaonensis TaxID=1045558 RepID=A0A1I2VGH6_9GAMM|nr:response regulator [Neptunomonas qingdaonensis]SFG86576.1 two-component system, LuxR family, response regulator FixJ [Neptunomonas qingdaonensis]
MHNEPVQHVFVVDDDADVRDSLKWLLESAGFKTVTYDSAQDFLENCSADTQGCILMDVRMPGMSGLSAQKKLCARDISLPLIMISGHADVDMAVTAMTQGALTFLQKPFSDQALIDHVQQALLLNLNNWKQAAQVQDIRLHYQSLTKRERQVFEGVVAGHANQEIADWLAINRKTVEGHRANMMAKMQANSLSELIRMSVALGLVKSFGQH